MRFARVDEALAVCEKHLDSTGSFGTLVERLMSDSLLVIIYAEFEQTVENTIQEKYEAIQDKSLRTFFGSFVGVESRRILPRGIKSGQMADFLARFGDTYKSKFRSKLDVYQRGETFYNNLISNRHDTAHSSGSSVTFLDIKNFYQEGHLVLDFFRDTLLEVDTSRE